jgi:phosphatidylserine decarboxylase
MAQWQKIISLLLIICFASGKQIKMEKQIDQDTVVYYNNTHIVEEKNDTMGALRFFYRNRLGKQLRCLINRRWLGQLVATYYNSSLSKSKIPSFIQDHNIDLNEYKKSEIDAYASFNDFFIRELKVGARSIDPSPSTITSPADSKVLVIPDISKDVPFFVKNHTFDLEKFLGDATLAKQFYGGTMMIFRLAPYDYHHFHFPVDCIPSTSISINGLFESVNPIVYKEGIQPLTENERHLILLKTEKYDTIAMVPVGAMIVGKIIETYTPGQQYKKGDDAGYFAFGGSTVVLLFKPNVMTPNNLFVQHSEQGIETSIRVGEKISE